MTHPSVEPPASLAQRLRSATRAAHVEAELAFDLDSRLADRHAYAGLLTALHPFHAGAEASLRRVPGWDDLDPAVDLAGRQRAFLILRDLDALGVAAPPAGNEWLPELESLAAALGCLYVLEGSSLGGGIVAHRARARLGDVPVGFFSGSGRRVGAEWRSLQRALDAFGSASGEPVRARVVSAAHETFAAFTRRLACEVQVA